MFTLSSVPAYQNNYSSQVLQSGDETQTVAVIEIDGIISSQKQIDLWGNETPDMASEIINKIDQAQNDESVKAILLKVNTPGGEAYASKLIHNKLVEFKETGKPLVVLMQDTAASGGYMVSAPADEIVASEITTTGSIGVIVTGTDFDELYKKLGIQEFNIINSEGDMKVLENLNDKESESYKILQGILDDVYNDFVDMVANGRGMTKAEVIEVADGRIYSGKQAKDLGLVDQLGEEKEAFKSVASLADLDNPNFVRYENDDNPFSLYSLSLKKILFPELSAVESKKPGLSVQYLMKI
jgi:protease-4